MNGRYRESDSTDADDSVAAMSDVVRIARWLDQRRTANRFLNEPGSKAAIVVAEAVSDVGERPIARG